ncbi:MAG TPA: hypothetical protein V6C52_13465 [Coleofasciculaceae cyanobacterium]|jgi:hypothetical protein
MPLQTWRKLGERPGKVVTSGLLLAILPVALLAGCNVTASRQSTPPEARQPAEPEDSSATLRAEPYWFSCRSDADCVVETGVCGQPQALNKNFVTQYRDFRVRLEQMVDCIARPVSSPQTQAHCVKQRCAIKGEETPSTTTAP